MRLILVRHGDAHAGLHGTIAGPRGCSGLTELGRRQAELLRDHIARSGAHRVDRLLASELPRAIETAEIIAPALGFDVVPRDCDLCEVHVGDADGTDWADYSSQFGALDMEAEPTRVFAPGGDSWDSFHERVDALMARLASDHAGDTVMAVCHAGVIAATMRLRLGMDPVAASHLRPTNTGLTEWHHDAATGAWSLRSYNVAVHLDAAHGA